MITTVKRHFGTLKCTKTGRESSTRIFVSVSSEQEQELGKGKLNSCEIGMKQKKESGEREKK